MGGHAKTKNDSPQAQARRRASGQGGGMRCAQKPYFSLCLGALVAKKLTQGTPDTKQIFFLLQTRCLCGVLAEGRAFAGMIATTLANE